MHLVPNNEMAELEQRQDQLLKKLNILYDRIQSIGSLIQDVHESEPKQQQKNINFPKEVVLNLNPDNLPHYLNIILKESSKDICVSWHIHSSVPKEKVPKIKSFVKDLKLSNDSCNINLRLIFKSVSADPELKLSLLAVPIIGNVNILRYLSLVYPHIVKYNDNDFYVDGLLDICHLLEKKSDKDAIITKLFAQKDNWIQNNEVSIVDLAAYNAIKQMKSKPKSVPKEWYAKCEKFCVQ